MTVEEYIRHRDEVLAYEMETAVCAIVKELEDGGLWLFGEGGVVVPAVRERIMARVREGMERAAARFAELQDDDLAEAARRLVMREG
jgi:hypothetical protein